MSLFGFSMPRRTWILLIFVAVVIGSIHAVLEFSQDMLEPWGLIASYFFTSFTIFMAIVIGIKVSMKRDVKLDD